jgi:type IV secretory pathway VirB10-like protein
MKLKMKMPSSVSKLLENKYVLYFVFFLAITNVFGYMVTGNLNAVILFILVGYLVYCFNKNMIIVLTVPLILTSIFMSSGIIKEGLENATASAPTTTTAPATPPATATPPASTQPAQKKPATVAATTPTTPTTPTLPAPIIEPEQQATKAEEPQGHEQTTEHAGMTTMYKKNNRIDYASTVEDAYGDLNKILGGDGIKRLTEDTQKLMGQQMQLAEAMKSMSPLLEQAKGLMAGFDMKQFGDITAMAKQFGVSK